MKALFIGAGKRYEMALKFANLGWDIAAYEYDVNCPLNLLKLPVLPGKSWGDSEIYKDLITLSKEYDLILPFQDNAVEVLSGIKLDTSDSYKSSICVSPSRTASACLNKVQFEEIFSNFHFYPSPVCGMPAIVKPAKGFGSRGIKYLKEWQGESYEDCIVQREIKGGQEYSVDCYFDKNHSLIDFVPRERIEVAAGEVIKSCTISKTKFPFESIIKQVSQELKFCGPICMQFITCNNGIPWIMEINARFGGGTTLSIASGFNMIDLLKTEYIDMKPIENYKSCWKTNFYLSRCFVDYCYEKNSI